VPSFNAAARRRKLELSRCGDRLSAVEYISSAGLRALMTASRQKPKERRLAAVRLNAVVHEIFTISRFWHLVQIFATVEEASAAWDAPAHPQRSP
jgi:anti-anti-sigma factor